MVRGDHFLTDEGWSWIITWIFTWVPPIIPLPHSHSLAVRSFLSTQSFPHAMIISSQPVIQFLHDHSFVSQYSSHAMNIPSPRTQHPCITQILLVPSVSPPPHPSTPHLRVAIVKNLPQPALPEPEHCWIACNTCNFKSSDLTHLPQRQYFTYMVSQP